MSRFGSTNHQITVELWAGLDQQTNQITDCVELRAGWIKEPMITVLCWVVSRFNTICWFVDPNQSDNVIWLVVDPTCSQLNTMPLSDWFVEVWLTTQSDNVICWVVSRFGSTNHQITLLCWVVEQVWITTQHNRYLIGSLITTQHNTVIWLVCWSKPAHNST